jgi:hypothetical protein
VMGGGPPREVEFPAPVTTGRGGASCGVISGGTSERHGGTGRRDRGAP